MLLFQPRFVLRPASGQLPQRSRPTQRRTGLARISLGLLLACGALCGRPPTLEAQQVIVHSCFSCDDGDPTKDADGTKNGVVVWSSGAVHVVTQYYVYSDGTLVIQSGAVVKVADQFETDTNGQLTSWFPPTNLDGIFGVGGAIEIDGATITDIRDDSLGGDTNQDGTASSPRSSYYLAFSGSPQDHVMSSIIKYCNKLAHISSMKIAGNTFLAFGTLTSNFWSLNETDTINATPVIKENTFEFAGGGSLDLLGISPVVEGNTLRGGDGIGIGPAMVHIPGTNDLTASPSVGTTVVSNNTLEGITGSGYATYLEFRSGDNTLGLYAKVQFAADIRNNTVRSGSLRVPLQAAATITGNDVSIHGNPLQLWYDPLTDTSSRLTINNNRFSAEGFIDNSSTPLLSIPAALWQNDIFVNAQNNYWGDPTGPFDNSNADGLYNPRGKGIRIGDGINYLPFIGGTAPPPQDAVHITASVTPSEPLVPDTMATFTVSADSYDLKSAATGKIFVVVRDVDGVILNQPETSVDVTSGNHSASPPPVQVTVPALSSVVLVDAIIVPDSGGEGVHSNLSAFKVNRPASKFTITGITDVATGNFPNLVRGNKTTIQIALAYTLATTGHGQFEIDVKERVVGTGTVVNDYPLVTVDAPPGSDLSVTTQIQVDTPLRDVLQAPHGELYVQVTFKDDQGMVAGKQSQVLPINEAGNKVSISDVVPAEDAGGGQARPSGATYYLVGQELSSYCFFHCLIGTQNVNNWQIVVSPTEFLNSNGGIILQTSRIPVPLLSNLSTGVVLDTGDALLRSTFDYVPPLVIPSGARRVRFHFRLVAPDQNITVAYATYVAEVREATGSLAQAVPTGASQLAFSPLPVTLNFASNQVAGTATVDAFGGPFGAAAATSVAGLGVAATFRGAADATLLNGNLIPLNRYWGVYSDLQDGTFVATVSFTYDPATDFPAVPGFSEDRLAVAGLNPLSGALEVLPSTLDKAAHTVTATYTTFFDTYVLVSVGTPGTSSCVGDCNGDGSVTVDELLTMVSIALGSAPILRCAAGDRNQDGQITIDEILAAVSSALYGCVAAATPTPSATAPPATPTATPVASATASTAPSPTPSVTPPPASTPTASPTPTLTPTATSRPTPSATLMASATRTVAATFTATPTPSPSHTPATPAGDTTVAKSVASGAVTVANGMAAIPSVVTALVSGLQGSSASLNSAGALRFDDQVVGAAAACATRTCSGGFGNVTLTLTLNVCQLATPSGSVTVDATITLQAGGFSSCPSLILPPWAATVDLVATFKDQLGTTQLTARVTNLKATITPQLGGDCQATGATLGMLDGTISTEFPGVGTVTVSFQNTRVDIAVSAFSPACVPVGYSLTFNGAATLSTASGSALVDAATTAAPLAVSFDAFVIRQDASSSPTQTWLDGNVNAACFGGGVTLQTTAPLTQVVGALCPNSGIIKITAPPGQPQILYLPGGMVGIDTDFDGTSNQTFSSCVDPLLVCAAPPTPLLTATANPAATTTVVPSATSIATPSPTWTVTAGPTLSPSATATATAFVSPSPTVISTVSPTPSPTATPTPSRTLTPTATVTVIGLPNLTPFQPTGWSDKIVVTSQSGSTTDSLVLLSTDTLYVDWAVINNGTAPVTVQFTTQLYVDGTFQDSWTTNPPLDATYYSYVTGYVLGSLSLGTHTLTIKTDATNAIVESNEQDNQYTKMITISSAQLPNLTPFQPTGWSDKIVVTSQSGSTTDSLVLLSTDTMYVDWAVVNNGTAPVTAQFTTQLYVDGRFQDSWTTNSPLDATSYSYVTGYVLGSLSLGTHTLTIKTDATNAIVESNEQDNQYTKTITISGIL